MVPTHERLHAVDLAGAQVDLGLVVQNELVVAHGRPQFLDLAKAGGKVIVVGVAVHVVTAGGDLGLVHGDICLAQQGGEVASVVREEGDADADGAVHRVVVQVERVVQCRAEPSGHLHGVAVEGVLEQDRELVPTQSHQEVSATKALAQASTDLDQQLVPDVVAEVVVDRLEPVEVHHQQRLMLMLGVRQPHPCLQMQGPTVGQAREVVGGDLAAKVPHPHELAEPHLGAGGRRQQGHPGQANRQGREVCPAAHQKHPQPGRGGQRGHDQGSRASRCGSDTLRALLGDRRRLPARDAVDIQRDEGYSDRPCGIQR